MKALAPLLLAACLGLVYGHQSRNVLALCGDTQQTRQPDSFTGSCGTGGQTELTKTSYWKVFWLDGYSRSVDVKDTGVCYVNSPEISRSCWPQFATPFFTEEGGTAYWNQPTYSARYTFDYCVYDSVPENHRQGHACPTTGDGGGGVEECDYASQLCGGGFGGNPSAELPANCCEASPILIDVRGDGFALTPPSDGVRFDFNGDGVRGGPFSWTAANSDDAWLALDRDGNGRVDHAGELFGNFTEQPPSNAPHGFHALALFDTTERGGNADGTISRHDAVFADLRLWQDVNHDGVSEPGELRPLRDLGLMSIDLDYRESRRTDEHGNAFKYRARVRDVRDAQLGRWAWDVFLKKAP